MVFILCLVHSGRLNIVVFTLISTLLNVLRLLLPTQHLAIACHWSQRAAVIGDVVQVYSGSHGRTIVFCETKKDANELSMNASIKQVPETCCSFVDC